MRKLLIPLLFVSFAWMIAALGLDQTGLDASAEGDWDLAIVAGCRVVEGGEPSECLAARTDAAVALYKAGRVEHILFTGGVGSFPPAEAEVAAARALAAGVPSTAMLTESRSTSTLENARNAAALVDAELGGALQVVVVTDAYHTLRSRRVFGTYFDEVDSLGVRSPIPVRVRGAHREVLAIGWYMLNGRL